MRNKPKISVVITFFKEKDYQVKRTINSVLNQTLQDFEIICVLDNPDNLDLYNLLISYKNQDKRIEVIKVERNIGVSEARNLGILQSQTEYVALLDGDDEYFPEKLEKQYNFMMTNPELDMSGTYSIWVSEDENKEFLNKSMEIDEGIKYNSPIFQTTLMIKKNSFNRFGKYEKEFSPAEDYEFVLRWYLQGAKMDNVKEYLVKYYKYKSRNKNLIRLQTYQGIRVKLKYLKQLNLGLKHYLKIIFYDIPFFIILPQSIILKLVFFKNMITKK